MTGSPVVRVFADAAVTGSPVVRVFASVSSVVGMLVTDVFEICFVVVTPAIDAIRQNIQSF
jgi:hypothetical protein